MRVREVLEAYNEWLLDAGVIHAKDRVGLTARFLDTRTPGVGDRHIHDEDVERWDEQIAREAEAEEAAYKAGERTEVEWKAGPGQVVSMVEDVMSAAAQELLKIVKGEVTAKRYADDESPVGPDFNERIRAAECLLGNRTELDVKGLEGLFFAPKGQRGDA